MDAGGAVPFGLSVLDLRSLRIRKAVRAADNLRNVFVSGHGIEAGAIVFAVEIHRRLIAQNAKGLMLAPLQKQIDVEQIDCRRAHVISSPTLNQFEVCFGSWRHSRP